MTEINFTLTPAEHHAGWELKYLIKTGAHCINTSLDKDIVISKGLNKWNVAIAGKDRFVDDTSKLNKKSAFELAHTLMNA